MLVQVYGLGSGVASSGTGRPISPRPRSVLEVPDGSRWTVASGAKRNHLGNYMGHYFGVVLGAILEATLETCWSDTMRRGVRWHAKLGPLL